MRATATAMMEALVPNIHCALVEAIAVTAALVLRHHRRLSRACASTTVRTRATAIAMTAALAQSSACAHTGTTALTAASATPISRRRQRTRRRRRL